MGENPQFRRTQNYASISKEEEERRMLEGLENIKRMIVNINNNNKTPTKQQKLNEIFKEIAENRSYKLKIQEKLDLKNKELKELKEKELKEKDEQYDQDIKDINKEIDGLKLERTRLADKIDNLNDYYLLS